MRRRDGKDVSSYVRAHTFARARNHQIGKGDAELLGYYFLADLGYSVGKSSSTTLDLKEPNYYWHEVGGLEKPDIQGERECWVYESYFPADFPIRVLEIWVDRETGKIIGGNKISA